MDDLTFSTLRKTNVARCEAAFHSVDIWNFLTREDFGCVQWKAK